MTQTAQSLDETLRTHVARFTDRRADWDAFADARVEGFKRAQHRFIGSGASGKTDTTVIPAQHFTLSVMFVPPGQGNAPHTHEVEEAFFILEGKVKVIHGFINVGLEPAYLQVMLGKAKPELMTYTDDALQSRRDEHLRAATPRG